MSATGRLHTLMPSLCVKHNDNSRGTHSDVCHDFVTSQLITSLWHHVILSDGWACWLRPCGNIWHLSILFIYSCSSSAALWNCTSTRFSRDSFLLKFLLRYYTEKHLGVYIQVTYEVQATKHNTRVNMGGGEKAWQCKAKTMVNYERRIHYDNTKTKQQPEGGRGSERQMSVSWLSSSSVAKQVETHSSAMTGNKQVWVWLLLKHTDYI